MSSSVTHDMMNAKFVWNVCLEASIPLSLGLDRLIVVSAAEQRAIEVSVSSRSAVVVLVVVVVVVVAADSDGDVVAAAMVDGKLRICTYVQ
jgi:hypothetical protein